LNANNILIQAHFGTVTKNEDRGDYTTSPGANMDVKNCDIILLKMALCNISYEDFVDRNFDPLGNCSVSGCGLPIARHRLRNSSNQGKSSTEICSIDFYFKTSFIIIASILR